MAALILLGFAIAVVAAALVAAGEPGWVVALPAILPAGILCARWPAVAVGILVACTSAYGTLLALTPVPALKLADGLLVALWVAVLIGYLSGRRERRLYPSPVLVLLFAYVALSGMALLAGSWDAGFESFRLTAAHLSIVGLVAIAPWSARTYRLIGQALVAVAGGVAAYCVFRYGFGSSPGETALARATFEGLPGSTEIRFFGAFPSAQELTVWAAGAIPFCLGFVLCRTDRWRWFGLGAVGLALVALLAADVRTGVVAAVAGVVVTTLLFLGSQAFPSGRRIGAGVTGILLVIALGAVGYVTAVSGSPTREERLSAILDPSEDRNYQIRTERWDLAWEEIQQEPFGHGLGTAGTGSRQDGALPVGPTVLDSTYLKVGIEQGIPVMVLFAAMLLAMLALLAWRSIAERSPAAATYTVGAAGTLTALIVLFYASSYVESPSILPAWVAVALGLAMATGARTEPRKVTPGSRGGSVAPPPESGR